MTPATDAPPPSTASDATPDAAATPSPTATVPPGAPAADAPPAPDHDDGECLWPQTATADGSTYTLYAPQFESLTATRASARSAFSVTTASAPASAYGVLFFTADVDHDGPAGLIELSDLQVTRATFADGRSADAAATELETMLFGVRFTVNRSDVMHAMRVASVRGAERGPVLSTAAPTIRVVDRPAVLLLLDGPPVLRAIGDTGIGIAQNTGSLLAFDRRSATWFTRIGDGTWLHASDYRGPWVAGMAPTDAQRQAIESALPKRRPDPASVPAATANSGTLPDIVVSTVPLALVSIGGAPQMTAVADGLYAVSNANCSLFTSAAQDRWWLLASGRWFTATDLTAGPWTYASPASLPPSFAAIDPHGPWGGVLASVPGTTEHATALLQHDIPHVATLERSRAHARVSTIGGPVRMAPIAGTSMRYAVNASAPLIACAGKYYLCQDAAWFVSDAASGPWALCDSLPAEIDSIPPSCPVYNVTFVEVYGSTPETVTFGYTAGYMNSFVDDGTVVWGTGWSHPGTTGQGTVPADASDAPYDPTADDNWGPYAGWPSSYGYWPSYGSAWGGWNFGWAPGWSDWGLWGGPSWAGAGWWGPGWGFGTGFALGYGFGNAWDWGYHPWGWRDAEGWWTRHWGAAYRRGWDNAMRDANRAAAGHDGARGDAAMRNDAREGGASWSHAAGRANDVFANRNGQVMQRRGAGLMQRTDSGWQRAAQDAGRAASDARADAAPPARRADGSWRDAASGDGSRFTEADTGTWAHARARDGNADMPFRPDPNHNFDGSPRGAFARGDVNYADRAAATGGGGWGGAPGSGMPPSPGMRTGSWNGGGYERGGWGVTDQYGTYAQRWGGDYDRGLAGFNQDTGWYDRTVSRPVNPYGYGYTGWSNGYRGMGTLSGWGGARFGGGMRGGGGRR